jgi:hypothetical protein
VPGEPGDPRGDRAYHGRVAPIDLTPRVRQLVIATVAASIAGGVASAWLGLPVIAWVGLTPSALWGAGSALPGVPALWQLASYPFFALGPFDLILSALTYGWFAGDLERAWGGRLFVDRWWTLALGVAAATTLGAIVFPPLRDFTVVGPSPVLEGLLVAWGLTFPYRQIRILFFIPITGQQMVWLTVALVGLSAVFGGPGAFPFLVPQIAAIALGFTVARTQLSLRYLALRISRWRIERALDRERSRRGDDGPTLH